MGEDEGSGPVHVVPCGDLIEHELDGDECVCGPDVEYFREDGTAFLVPLITHHSLDGREQFE